MDTDNFFAAGFKAVLIKFLHVDVFSLLVINMLGLIETFPLQSDAFFLKCFHLSDHPVDFYSLHSVELTHVNIWVLTFNNLSRRDLTSSIARLRLYIQHFVDFALYNFIDLLLLAFILFFESCITLLVLKIDKLGRKLILLLVIFCHESQTLFVSLTLCFKPVKVFLKIFEDVSFF